MVKILFVNSSKVTLFIVFTDYIQKIVCNRKRILNLKREKAYNNVRVVSPGT